MAQYRFDFLSLRGYPISRQNVECENNQDAIERALGLLAQDRPGSHVEVWLSERLVWSSRTKVS